MIIIKDVLKTLRINHYIKNFLVLVPLLFSINCNLFLSWVNCLIIFVVFCMISSAVYIFNDLADIENDKKHPIKCNRPIASKKIPLKEAIVILIILLVLSLIIALYLNKYCFYITLSYFILNIFYSIYFKKIPLVDALCIALGFILRIMAGCYAINVPFSSVLIFLTFFTSLFFIFSKRKLEFKLPGNTCRESLIFFNMNLLNLLILLNAILSIYFYTRYIFGGTITEYTGTEFIRLTIIPFILIILRLLYLGNTKKIEHELIYYIERDNILKILTLLFIIILIIALNI